jgi:formamidopyrimidine-DNA glycosylase
MPELPDVEIYVEALRERIAGHRLNRIALRSPFLLRSTEPPLQAVECQVVGDVRRRGKRICIEFDGDLWLVLHLMIAGRLHWRPTPPKLSSKGPLAVFEFDNGALTLTEAGTQHRAGLYVVKGLDSLPSPGVEPLEASLEEFTRALVIENHTLKRSLTDPRLFSGIGNAYSDEILHRAQLSPVAMTQRLTPEQVVRLYDATRETLLDWVARLRADAAGKFPEKVTAFREGMAVHGRYREPCPRCGAKVQRIRYAANETNYCPTCQTGGKLLADRGLSRLLREDWPRTAEELERKMHDPGGGTMKR